MVAAEVVAKSMPSNLGQFAFDDHPMMGADQSAYSPAPTLAGSPSTGLPQTSVLQPAAKSPYPAYGVGWGMQGGMGGNNLPNSAWNSVGGGDSRIPERGNSQPARTGMFGQPSNLTDSGQSGRQSSASTSRTSFGSPVPNVQRAPSPYNAQSNSYQFRKAARNAGIGEF